MNQDTKEPRDFSQMYYWEVNWPRFFSNRDYVCSRRSKVFKDKEGNDDVIVIFSKSAEHSNYPKKACYVLQFTGCFIYILPKVQCVHSAPNLENLLQIFIFLNLAKFDYTSFQFQPIFEKTFSFSGQSGSSRKLLGCDDHQTVYVS